MKKRILVPAILSLCLALGAILPGVIASARAGEPEAVTVFIDGSRACEKAVLIESTAYVPFSEFCRALGASGVTWDGTKAAAHSDKLRIEAAAGDCYIIANGRYLYVPDLCLVIGGELFAPVRVLGRAFGAQVIWSSVTETVSVYSGSGTIESGDSFYGEEDLLWMSRIIYAEARGESMTGKIAVGNVIMNRIASPQFPDSVYKVVFDKRSGIQFTPAYSGAIYNNSSPECVAAAKLALDGADVVGDSLYFSQSRVKSWAARNRQYTATIGNHSFYG